MYTSIPDGQELIGACLRGNTTFERAGTLESTVHCAVSANGSSLKEITDPSFTDFEMKVTGACLGDNITFVRTGSLESAVPFAVSVNGSSLKESTAPSCMELIGAWLGDNTNFGRTGSLEGEVPFAARQKLSSLEEISDPSGTDFLATAELGPLSVHPNACVHGLHGNVESGQGPQASHL